jgi:hypothetical protein
MSTARAFPSSYPSGDRLFSPLPYPLFSSATGRVWGTRLHRADFGPAALCPLPSPLRLCGSVEFKAPLQLTLTSAPVPSRGAKPARAEAAAAADDDDGNDDDGELAAEKKRHNLLLSLFFNAGG